MKYLSLLLFALFLLIPTSAQNNSRKIISTPQFQPPAEAVESGLGGRVNVEVEVNRAGDVTEVKQVNGPDWICPNVKRPDALAIQQTARNLSLQVKYVPQEKGSTEWIGITFPVTKQSEEPDKESDTQSSNSGVTVTRKRPVPRSITGGIMNGRALRLIKPAYPPDARAARAAGIVSIQVLIEEDGSVFSAQPVSGHPMLRTAARFSACYSEFSPTKLEGKPVKVSGVITYNFVP